MKRTLRYFLRFGRLELIALIAGFCLLAYELVAARLLAPYIGSSIYVFTSVIGVIILSLSLGYAFGGWLADRREKLTDVPFLLLFSAAGATFTLIAYTAFLEAIVVLIDDPRLQGLLASLILFAPASFILGSISPYLAKLKLKSISTTGRVVASLSAINSFGGIIGTLVTGFILLGYVGSKQILALLIVLLIGLSWTVLPGRHKLERVVISLTLIGVSLYSLSPPQTSNVLADIDTPTARYVVQTVAGKEKPFRVLLSGPGAWQSGAYNDGSSQLVFWYTKAIAKAVELAPKKDNILILGGGAFSLPRYLSQTYPNSQLTVLEIDPQLPKIAKDYFFYEKSPNTTIVSQDGRAFLEKNQNKFDIIIVDAFSETNIPFTLTTQEYAATLARATNPSSQVIVNLIVGSEKSCGQLFSGIDSSYKRWFQYATYQPQFENRLGYRQNVITTYAHQPLPESKTSASITPYLYGNQTFTDNFSTSDRLNFECLNQ